MHGCYAPNNICIPITLGLTGKLKIHPQNIGSIPLESMRFSCLNLYFHRGSYTLPVEPTITGPIVAPRRFLRKTPGRPGIGPPIPEHRNTAVLRVYWPSIVPTYRRTLGPHLMLELNM